MGRPLNKKYIGGRNRGADGNLGAANTAGDADLGGTNITSVGTITAGSTTSAITFNFPVPLLAGNGGVRATGTPIYKVVSATISGGTGYGNAQTFNLTVNTAAGYCVLNVTSGAGGDITTVNSVTTAGSFTGISAVTTISGGTGTGATPVLTYGILGATITNAGSGYVASSTNTINITAGTAPAALTLGTVTSAAGGNFSFSTAQSAGTFWVGQIITVTGTIGGTTWTGYSTGNNYIVSATNGTSQITLVALTSATGLPTAAQTTSAGTTTGLTFTTAGTYTVSTTDGLMATGQKLVVSGTGGQNLSAGTYYVLAVNSATNQISVATTYASFFTSTTLTPTTGSITGTTGVGSQHLVIAVSAGGGALSGVLAAEVTTGYTGRYASIVGMAITSATGVLRQDADLIKQENTQRFKVETQDGVAYCKLVTALPTAAGQVAINATDSAGGTYWVSKITNRRLRVTRNTGTQFADGSTVNWTFGSAVANVSVKIDNV